MTAAILTSCAILAVVAMYGIHVWREVRLAQTKARSDLSGILHATTDSQSQRVLDALERSTTLNERLAHKLGFGPKPRLEVDNDPTGGDAA